MATWTAATAIPNGGLITGAWMNNVVGAVNFLGGMSVATGKDLFYGRQGSTQSISAGAVLQALSFGSEDIDTAGGHDNTTNNSRYYIKAAGKYRLIGGVAIPNTVTDSVTVGFAKNGIGSFIHSGAYNSEVGQSINQLVLAPVTYTSLIAGDYVELCTYRGLTGFSTYINGPQSFFGVEWIGA